MDTFHISKLVLVIIGVLISIGVVAYILRATTLAQQGATREQFEKDKLMQGFKLFFAFIGIGTFAFVMIAFIINHNKNRTTSSGVGNVIQKQEIEYDSVMKEYLESIGMKLSYKSKEYKYGSYKKGTINLDYNEDNNGRYVYILTDNSEDNIVFFDKILNYFFDVSPGTSAYLYKYITVCKQNEFIPNLTIYNNHTKLYVTSDDNNKIKYIITKAVDGSGFGDNSIEIKNYNIDMNEYSRKLIEFIFGKNIDYTIKKTGDYTHYNLQ